VERVKTKHHYQLQKLLSNNSAADEKVKKGKVSIHSFLCVRRKRERKKKKEIDD